MLDLKEIEADQERQEILDQEVNTDLQDPKEFKAILEPLVILGIKDHQALKVIVATMALTVKKVDPVIWDPSAPEVP